MLTPCSSLCNPVKSTMSQLQSYMSVAGYAKVHCLHWLQWLEDVLQNMCSQKLLSIQRKIIVLEVERAVAWKLTTLSKRRLQQRRFPVNIAKFLKNCFFYRTAWSYELSLSMISTGKGCLYLPVPGPLLGHRPWPPICICRAWHPICIYRHWPTILLPVRGLSLDIPTLFPQFAFVFTALSYNLYYRSGAWICIYFIIGSSSSSGSSYSGSNFLGINSTNICMTILVN